MDLTKSEIVSFCNLIEKNVRIILQMVDFKTQYLGSYKRIENLPADQKWFQFILFDLIRNTHVST